MRHLSNATLIKLCATHGGIHCDLQTREKRINQEPRITSTATHRQRNVQYQYEKCLFTRSAGEMGMCVCVCSIRKCITWIDAFLGHAEYELFSRKCWDAEWSGTLTYAQINSVVSGKIKSSAAALVSRMLAALILCSSGCDCLQYHSILL